MRIPPLKKVESALKHYGFQILVGVLASLGLFFQDWLVGLAAQVPLQTLATIVVWLTITVIAATLVSAFYILKAKTLEKVVLKFDPNYYDHREFGEAFDKFNKNS